MSHWCGCCAEFEDVFRLLKEDIQKMSEKEKALLRVQWRKGFRQPSVHEPLLDWPTVGSFVIVQLHDGRKIQAVVKAVHDTVGGKKFQIVFENITMKVGPEQILKQQ